MFDSTVGGRAGFPTQFAPPAATNRGNDENPPRRPARLSEQLIKYYPWAIVVVVLAHLLYLIFLNTHPAILKLNGGRVIDDSFILFGELVILVSCLYAFGRIQQLDRDTRESMIKRARLAILFLTASAICNALGQVIWIWYDATLPAVPYPALDDALFLANYPFFFIGIALLIPRGGSAAGRARVFVDAGTLILSVLAIFWYFVLGPTLATLSGTALVKTVSLAYPLSDLAASVAAILLYLNPFNSAVPRRTLARLTLAIACSAISNMIYGYIQVGGTYYTGMYVDLGFPLTWMLIAWAIFTYPSDIEQMLSVKPEQRPELAQLNSRFSAIFRSLLPLLFTLLTSVLLLLEATLQHTAPIEQVVLVCAALFLLPVVRQSLTVIDNTMLNERLRVALNQSQSAFLQSQDQLVSTSLRAEQLEELLNNIRNIQEVHASLARGDFSVRANVGGPLSSVAQSLNLLIERMNRWSQVMQINQDLTDEANGLCHLLEVLSNGNVMQNLPASHNPLPTSNALLLAGRLQTRLQTRFQKQREKVQFTVKRLQTLKDLLQQARSDMHDEKFDFSRSEQFLAEIQRGLASYETQLQELWNLSNLYDQNRGVVSTTKDPAAEANARMVQPKVTVTEYNRGTAFSPRTPTSDPYARTPRVSPVNLKG